MYGMCVAYNLYAMATQLIISIVINVNAMVCHGCQML